MPTTTDDRVAELERKNAELGRELEARIVELKEARARQAATSAVLEAISRSPDDTSPVFEAIVEGATRLCRAEFTAVARFEGGLLHLVATNKLAPEEKAAFHSLFPRPAQRNFAMGRAFLDGGPVQFADVLAEPDYDPTTRAVLQSVIQYRSFLGVPILREGRPIGVIGCGRREVRPVTDDEIAILQTFAGQAAIALENARLIAETQEALDQQTATAEVLQVINASPGDLAPVFDAILLKAHKLCEASFGGLMIYDGDRFRPVALQGVPAPFAEFIRQGIRPEPGNPFDRMVDGAPLSHIPDLSEVAAEYPNDSLPRAAVDLGGIRTFLAVPLRKDNALIGAITAYRKQVRPFSDKQIALLQNFAAQAVIAMENARLLTETREALEQQTATAEVLQVINSSPGELAPVFDAMLEKAMRLCGAAFGIFAVYDGEHYRVTATHGLPARLAEFVRQAIRIDPGSMPDRLRRGESTIQVPDITALGPDLRTPGLAAMIELADAHTAVWVPLRKDGVAQGFFGVYRREVRPFSDKQLALLQNFAAQAVIAMENARLITETREALEQQTATTEVLQVINSSPGDLTPVFDAILEKASAVCGFAQGSLNVYDGEYFCTVATRGVPEAFAEVLRQPRRSGPQARFLHGDRIVHIPDLTAAEYAADRAADPVFRAAVELGGIRTVLFVPLRKDQKLLGYITANRREVRPFTEKQIALLQNFAAQAVIAMENARLLTETREALEQQTATSEVLGMISSSPGRLEPVFDAILASAVRVCAGKTGMLALVEDGGFRGVAVHGIGSEFAATLSRLHHPPPGTGLDLLQKALHTIQIADCAADPAYDAVRALNPGFAAVRTALHVPMIRDAELLGAIAIYRDQVRPFDDKEVDLVENFAKQAVIAIENTRLITEIREALEQQTATAEVLQVINSSPGDLAPVFEAMLEKGTRLCGASLGTLWAYDGERMHPLAMRGVSRDYAEYLSHEPLRPGAGALGRFVRGETLLHVVDLKDTDAYRNGDIHRRALVDLGGGRSLLGVPLRTDDQLRGAFLIYRREPQPFTDKQIALLQNFAAQAVIAMENARLLTETREALEQQTATSEVLQVINSSPGDLAPVFDAMLERAMRLCDAAFGGLWTFDDDRYVAVAARGVPRAYSAFLAEATMMPGPGTAPYRFLRGERLVHNIDLASEEPYLAGDPQRRALVDLGGARTALQVPLRKDGIILGVITIYRQQVRPFSDKQIAVLENFAGQAVIAMENARLLGELRQRTRDLEESLEYQVAVGDVLKIISRSAFDLETVLQTVVTTAVRLCRADSATIYRNINGEYRWAAGHMLLPEYEQIERKVKITPDRGTLVGRAVTEGRTVQILDAWTDPLYEPKHDARIGGVHTMLGLPLLREGVPIGAIGLARRRVEAFSEREVQLVTTFADQAVIAIENARLLGELRERTEELAAREAELRVTFDNMADGVAMFDAELQLAAWNRNFQELLDLPDAFVAERPRFADYFRYLAERGEYGSPELEAELSPSIADTGREVRLERTRPNGRIIEVRRNPAPGGGFVLIYSDITERKRAEEAIRAARDAAETALRDLQTAQASLIHAQKMAALGQLTAGVAHEIKNPLNFVNNFAGLSVELLDELRETTGPVLASLGGDARAELDDIVQTLTGNLNKIAEHGRRADGIVKSMLEHSRSGSSERRSIDINALIEEALNLAYHGARAEYQSFNIALDRDLERDIAPIEVMPQDLTRVFLNLFGNGFYAADKRRRAAPDAEFRPALRVATRDFGSEVEIRVRDNGTGIAPEFRDKLFQPFFTTKPTGEGTGLGLSISYDIVTQQHGGTITVDSKLGEFTEFTIRLPRRSAAAGAQNH